MYVFYVYSIVFNWHQLLLKVFPQLNTTYIYHMTLAQVLGNHIYIYLGIWDCRINAKRMINFPAGHLISSNIRSGVQCEHFCSPLTREVLGQPTGQNGLNDYCVSFFTSIRLHLTCSILCPTITQDQLTNQPLFVSPNCLRMP